MLLNICALLESILKKFTSAAYYLKLAPDPHANRFGRRARAGLGRDNLMTPKSKLEKNQIWRYNLETPHAWWKKSKSKPSWESHPNFSSKKL